jgi:hypothetical protein
LILVDGGGRVHSAKICIVVEDPQIASLGHERCKGGEWAHWPPGTLSRYLKPFWDLVDTFGARERARTRSGSALLLTLCKIMEGLKLRLVSK